MGYSDLSTFDKTPAVKGNQEDFSAEDERLIHEPIKWVANFGKVGAEIAALAPLQQVLNRICEITREMLRTDIGYITLCNPPEKVVEVRASAGTSPAFIGTAVRYGEGIGGRVIETREPTIFTDYAKDSRSDPKAAMAIRHEQITAGIAVPLYVGADVIGVLFAVTRIPRNFTKDHVMLLMSLGTLASVAIRNAQLFAQTNRLLQIHQDLLDTPHSSENDGITQALSSLSRLLKCDAWYIDSLGHASQHICWPGSELECELDNIVDVPAMIKGSERFRTPFEFCHDEVNGLMVALMLQDNQIVGYLLVLRSGTGFDEIDHIAIERASSLIIITTSRQEIAQALRLDLQNSLLHDILVQPNMGVAMERAKYLQVDLCQPHKILLAVFDPQSTELPSPEYIESINRRLKSLRPFVNRQLPYLLSHVSGTQFIALVGAHRHVDIAKELRRILQPEFPELRISVIVSSVCSVPEGYAELMLKVKKLVPWLTMLNFHGSIVDMDRIDPFLLLFDPSNIDVLQRFCKQILDPIYRYDQQHSANLLLTLKAFLDNESELRPTAANLHIHYNSLRYRLERIQNVFSIDLSDTYMRQRLRMAFLLDSVLHIYGHI